MGAIGAMVATGDGGGWGLSTLLWELQAAPLLGPWFRLYCYALPLLVVGGAAAVFFAIVDDHLKHLGSNNPALWQPEAL